MPNTQFRKRIIAVVILSRLVFMKYFSKPSNPKLVNIFFKSGMIEAWGRGFEKIKDVCGLHGGPLPEYEINESGIMVLCKACDRYFELLPGKAKVDSIISNKRIMIG